MHLAWPILIGQVAQVAMGVADTVMAGAVSADDLAGVAVGFSLWLPLSLLGNGIFTAATALIARAHGAGERDRVAAIFQQAVWLAILVGIINTVLVANSSALLEPMAVDPAVRPIATRFLQGIAAGFPAMTLVQVLRSFSEGSGRSKPAMIINLCALLVNIPLNYVLIHGLFGAPRLGGAGCGWATGISLWLQCLALGTLLFPRYRYCLSGWARPRWQEVRILLQMGLPTGAAVFAEVSIFALVALLIGHLGATIIASHQIALNFSGLVFMVPFSLSIALTVKVGHALGAGDAAHARRIARLGSINAILFSGISATAMLFLANTIVTLYSDDSAVRALSVQLLHLAALFQLSDGLQVTAAGSLRGYHDTRITMFITLLAYWGIGLPVGYTLGLTDLITPALGVRGLWMGLVLGLTVAAVLLNWRLLLISRRPAPATSH